MRSCSRTLVWRSVRTSMMPERSSASARSSAARNPGMSSTRSCASPYSVAAASESGPVVLLTGDGALAHDVGGLLAARRNRV